VRFAVAYAEGNGKGHVQSLILGAVLFIAAIVLWALGVIGDLLAAQRVMTQRTFERVRRVELELKIAPSHYGPGSPHARAQADAHEHAGAGVAGDGSKAKTPGDPEEKRAAGEPEALRL
jgi:hypothetical protein